MFNLLSIFTGALISIMITLNSFLGSSLGNYTSSVVIHLAGLIAVIIVLFLKKSKIKYDKNIPLLTYSAGAIGVFTVLFSNLSISVIGASLTVALGLLGQTLSSIVIDQYGLLGMKICRFDEKKIFGLTLIVIGIIIMTLY